MNEPISLEKVEATEEGWPTFEVWQEYEKIAMHFNDLLMRLRTQALGAVAALATQEASPEQSVPPGESPPGT